MNGHPDQSADSYGYAPDESGSDTDLVGDTDAMHWAERFASRFRIEYETRRPDVPSGIDDVQGLMLAWFAGAIDTGRMAERKAAAERDGHQLSDAQIAAHRVDRYPSVKSQVRKVVEEAVELSEALAVHREMLTGHSAERVADEYADTGLALYALGRKLGLDLIDQMRRLVEADQRTFAEPAARCGYAPHCVNGSEPHEPGETCHYPAGYVPAGRDRFA